jgi:adenylyltransferase/sulfurtransferase
MLSDPQIERYSRQIILPQVGGKGQQRLLRAGALAHGDDPWQATALLYLAAAGVGRLGICGAERLPLWAALTSTSDESMIVALRRLNPDCTIIVHDDHLRASHEKYQQLVQSYDLVIAEPHEALHAACYAARRPFVCGYVSVMTASLAVYRGYEDGQPCFSCEPPLFSLAPPSPAAEEFAAPFLGTVLATEAVKLILHLSPSGGTPLRQYHFPALSFTERSLVKNGRCRVCQPKF